MMKKRLVFILGIFLVSQYAIAGNYGEADVMDEAADQQGSVEQFEQTLEDSPTAAGLPEVKENPSEMGTTPVQGAKEPMGTGEADMLQEELISPPAAK